MNITDHIAVIGAGITGPTLSLTLAKLGYSVDLFEAHASRVEDAGSFLNLAPNGRTVLERLGVVDHVLSAGYSSVAITFSNHKGRMIASNPEVTTNIMRGSLSAGLREAAVAAGVRIHTGKRLAGLMQLESGCWKVKFTDGSLSEATIVLGCDGVHSVTRSLLMPGATAPSYTGVIGSGGCSAINEEDLPVDGKFHMTFGLQGFFGYQVVEPGVVYWFENHAESDEPTFEQLAQIPDETWVTNLVQRHHADPKIIARILQASVKRVGRWPVYEVPPLTTWHRGTAAVLGDAAHAVAPHLGQGASLGMEDAYELALTLDSHNSVVEAFTSFEESRRDRIVAVSKQAQQTGSVMTPNRRIVRFMRDLMLPLSIKRQVGKGSKAYSYSPSPWPE